MAKNGSEMPPEPFFSGRSDGRRIRDGGRPMMLKRSRRLVFVAAVAVHAALATPAFGAECNGVTSPDTVRIGGTDLENLGLGPGFLPPYPSPAKASVHPIELFVSKGST